MSPRILQVIASAERRGAETFAVGLERQLASLGHMVKTVAVEPGSKPVLDVEILGERWSDPRSLWKLRQLMADADVVVAHGSSALPATAAAGIGCSTPVVYRQISDPEQWTVTRFRRGRVRLYLRRMLHVVALTERTGSLVAERFGVSPAMITVIPNGADSDHFVPPTPEQRQAARRLLNLAENEFVILWMGALSSEKRPLLAIEVINRLCRGRLLIAGDGPLAGEVSGASIHDAVQMLGSVDDPRSLYHAADVFLLTSRTESLPAVLIEAGMCAVPVVAFDVGDVVAIVDNEFSGLVVDAGDVAAMVDGLNRIRDDAALRTELAVRARSKTESRFGMAEIGRQWSALLGAVVAQHG